MAFEGAVIATCWAATLGAALLAMVQARRRSRRAGALEAENESLRDALWKAVERETAARREGERALEEAKAGAAAGDRAKSRFLATVTHEMRTPLSGVVGTAELLLETPLAADQKTYARAVKSSAEAMLSLVDEILDVSRIEADRPSLQPALFGVAGLVEEIAELLAPRAHARGLDLAVLVSPDVPAEIVADAARVRQVLINLAGNALKFTHEGGVGLRVDAVTNGVRFVVVDTGPGFDPVETERLFQEFERAGDDRSAGGVGLGLAISRKLAEAMGGTVDAWAAPGEGATFTLTLPHAGAVGDAGRAPLAGRRVVVASAAPFTGPWLVESLLSLGADAALAPLEAEALASAVSARAADVVLIDRGPAGLAERLGVAARRAGAAKTLLLLAPSERGELSRLAATGFDGYLVKPVRPSSLLSRIEEPRPQTSEPDAASSREHMAFPARGGLEVLVAEDDPVSALIALAHLARLGHAAVHVADGAAACEAFEGRRFDAVLLDLRMPRLDGCSAARRMRDHEASAGQRAALIVALTANVSEDDRAAARAAGMDDLFGKPLDRVALEDILAPLARAADAPRVAGSAG